MKDHSFRFLIIFFLLKHRLQLEEQLRQQLDNQRRVEEMHALESKSNDPSKKKKNLLNLFRKIQFR
jgi:hypothetical protein